MQEKDNFYSQATKNNSEDWVNTFSMYIYLSYNTLRTVLFKA